jgi:ribosome-associated translation inhibitor RaiA
MKLSIRFRDIDPSPALLDHVKASFASAVRPHPWRVSRMRASLMAEGLEWVRCRLEATLPSGGLRVIEVASTDALVAVDMAAERLASLLEHAREAAQRPTRARRLARAA